MVLGITTSLDRTLIPSAIQVNAGADKVICLNQSLLISSLNATITGDVSDGDWTPLGDGRFQPGNQPRVKYSAAQTQSISYVPGPNDRALGFFRLMLLSDAPVGKPLEKVSDEVRINFQSAPPLFCASNINISLDENCMQVVTASMLQPNPVSPISHYIVTLYDAAGKIIPNNTLTKDHIDKEITYKLGHQCTPNICWGKFKVEDYYPPLFVCRNDTILCTRPVSPTSVGLPIPAGATIISSSENKFVIGGWDKCSDVNLEYVDEIIKANCSRDEDRTINRKWKATDAKGNMSMCEQKIVIKRLPLSLVTFPPHYDGHENPALECGSNFPVLPNGHPSPDTTGAPGVGFCTHLQFKMTDVRFDLCGKSYKLARSWFVIDWCSTESVTKNQIIMVSDTKGPVIECLDTLRLHAGVYHCASVQTLIPDLLKGTDCNAFSVKYELKDTTGNLLPQYIISQNGKRYINNLPVGQYHLYNIAADTCGNSTACKTFVHVEDKIAPSVSCDLRTKVSITSSGTGRLLASTIDDGSIDNCAIASFKVRKMTDKCGFNNVYADYVDFCCDEIGSVIMVALQVTDIYGNSNTCMAEVIVEDKTKPTITCPPNITLTCTENIDFTKLDIYGRVVTKASDVRDIKVFNYYHNGVVGKDGLANDNCKVFVSQKYNADIKCDTGTIIRTFIVRDSFGLTDSCKQTITIKNPNPFNGNDPKQLIWPKNYEGQDCRNSSIDPKITGKPQFTNDACGLIESTYDDTPFYIADSACVKIIRKWTVVDWCQLDLVGSKGKWGPYIQIIKLHNTDRPYFTGICKDTSFCSYDDKCRTGRVTLVQSALDSCTAVSDLIWKYEIDIFNNGSIDSTGHKNEFIGDLPIGTHKIIWRVEDQCGNFNICTQTFTIKDCKNPIPYCLSSLTTSLMQATGAVEIWAKDFDKGSTDNCTHADSLIFTFHGALPVQSMLHVSHFFKGKGIQSDEQEYKAGMAQKWIPATKSSGLFFDCARIPDGKSVIIPLAMSITDLQSNQDSCVIDLVLQDNANVCPDVVTSAQISGRITTSYGKTPQEIDVLIESSEYHNTIIVDNSSGLFTTERLPLGKNYVLQPSLNSDPLAGVSALDLVKIQRHILDIEAFDNPYQLIAADINSSASITAGDLVELRKLILGIYDKFPKGLPSWVFVKKENGISDPKKPYNYIKNIETGLLQKDITNADFVAVKIGDVNHSALNFQDYSTENRSNTTICLKYNTEQKENKTLLHFRASEDIMLDAIQLFLEVRNAELLFGKIPVVYSEFLAEHQAFSEANHFRLIAHNDRPAVVSKGEVLFSIELVGNQPDMADLSFEKGRRSEGYFHDVISKINLQKLAKSDVLPITFKLLSNPVTDQLVVVSNSPLDQELIQYTIVDQMGRAFLSGHFLHQEESTIPIRNQIPAGVYLLKLKCAEQDHILKFICIK